jgi:diguanylate cyclase (GGDEF)-like protein
VFQAALAAERAALDELALDGEIGATTEAWGSVAALVRRASFDLLAALGERMHAARDTITDPLTAARTRAFFDAALTTECDRAERFGDRLALILVKVDDLPGLDGRLGSGVGDRIVRRLGILVRRYFRRQDLVARFANDAIAIVLVRSDADHADALADRVRATVERRLESADHRSGESVLVTVSAGVVHAGGRAGTMIDPERLVLEAERALQQAATRGGNRVESVEASAPIRTPPRSSPST